jgi:hypothetical protein
MQLDEGAGGFGSFTAGKTSIFCPVLLPTPPHFSVQTRSQLTSADWRGFVRPEDYVLMRQELYRSGWQDADVGQLPRAELPSEIPVGHEWAHSI